MLKTDGHATYSVQVADLQYRYMTDLKTLYTVPRSRVRGNIHMYM